jgi:serine/threonine protein kinase
MERLGRYEIMQELGRGAMGVVYKARDPNIDRVVAIKIITPEAGMDPSKVKELQERFQREARAAGRLQHPNIVPIYDFSEYEGRPYLVMEFVAGKPLDSLINAGHDFSLQDVASIADQVAQGLDYAHMKGIVHRDIRPANIMMTTSGVAKIADFGIARITETSITRTGLAVGTPSYMSPEQVAGQKVDGRSDQWSLGVMLYELLSGEKAFPGDSLTTVLYRIMQEDPIPLRRVNPGLPEAVDAILMKAMSKSPADRYPRAADLGRDMLAVVSGGVPSVLAGAPPPSLDDTIPLGRKQAAPRITHLEQQAPPEDFFATQRIRTVVSAGIYEQLKPTLKFRVDYCKRDCDDLSRRANVLSWLWMGCIAVFGCAFVASLILIFYDAITKAIATVVSGALFYFVQRILRDREDYFRELFAATTRHLEYANQWLLVMQAIDGIEDPGERARQQARVMEALHHKLEQR